MLAHVKHAGTPSYRFVHFVTVSCTLCRHQSSLAAALRDLGGTPPAMMPRCHHGDAYAGANIFN